MAVPEMLLHEKQDLDWLSEDEKAALKTMASARRRAQFVAGRWLLHFAARSVLGDGVRYRVELVDQRPFLALEGTEARVAASLSHSGERVLCAIAAAGLVGVDVERIRPRREWDRLAAFVLHPSERSRLEALEEPARWQGFYRVWTLKEAMAKALGVGLALPFSRILFSDDNRVAAAPGEAAFTGGIWRFYTPRLDAGYAAAAAWREGAS